MSFFAGRIARGFLRHGADKGLALSHHCRSIKRAKPDARYTMHNSKTQIQLEWVLMSQKNVIAMSSIKPMYKVTIASWLNVCFPFIYTTVTQRFVHDQSLEKEKHRGSKVLRSFPKPSIRVRKRIGDPH